MGNGVRAVVGFVAAGVAGAGAVMAGGGGWLVAASTGVGGAVGAFAPGWVDAGRGRAERRERFEALAGPAAGGSLTGLLRPERGVVPFRRWDVE